MGGGSYNFEKIPQMVASGKLSVAVVDEAVRRTLRAKFAAGLFENPYRGVPDEEQAQHIHTDEAVELARRLDAESIVLLENRDNVLPLRKDAKIAVIGPMAHGPMNVRARRRSFAWEKGDIPGLTWSSMAITRPPDRPAAA